MSKYDDYMTTEELANFIGVSKSLVKKWRNRGWLMPDVIGHGKDGHGRAYYYSKERVLQLASVYVKKFKKTPFEHTMTPEIKETHVAYTMTDYDKQNCIDETKNFMPMTTKPNFDAIPQVLKDLRRWLCWQLQPADPKPKKVPMTPKFGKLVNAAVNKPENWLSFDEAISYYNRGLCSGIGFALTNTPPKVCCVDVDHCFNPDGTLNDEAKAVMETCQNSFTEISQSNDGGHIWFIDEEFNGGRRKGNVEVYAADRYIAMTGVRVPNSSEELLNVNGACNDVIAKFIDKDEENLFDDAPARTPEFKSADVANFDSSLSDDDRRLIEYFRSDKCKARDINMFDLFNGNTAEYFKNTGKPFDDSLADCDFMLKLLYYVGNAGTDEQIGCRALKIFGQSALAKRDKWLDREDYRLRTLNAAFDIWVQNGRKAKALDAGKSAKVQYARTNNDGLSFGISDSTSPKTSRQERADFMNDLMTTREVADFIGVSVSTVKNWRQRKLFGCYFFPADEKHGDTLYYSRERVEQLKAVYQFGILQNMYKLARKNPEPTTPDYFQKSDSSGGQTFGEELSFRHREFMILDEVADYFGVSVEAVKKWHQRGQLKEDMLGHNGDLYFGIDNVLEFVPPSKKKSSSIEDLKKEMRSVGKAIVDFDAEKNAALEKLRNVETFDSETVFADEVVTAGAFALLFDKQAYSDFRREIKLFGDKHKDKKATINAWVADVRDKADALRSRRSEMITRRNQIQAQINSLSFVGKHDALKDSVIPEGYSISETSGIVKVDGEKSIPVCRRPVVITGKTYSVDDKIYKLALSFMTMDGKWKELSPTEKAIVFNKNKLVDLANADLPVTTSNATHLVDFLDAFNALNESSLPLIYNVSRCGWYNFDGTDYFVDPRRDCVLTNEDKNISVKVDDVRSDFAKYMKKVGSLEEWKKIYKLAKKYPVARLTVSAAVAPILLKILGERNFLLYIYAPTRAGKTTALYLGASAVGSEKIIRSFDATKNGLAGAAADVNDYPFLVDEKQVADNRISEQMSNLIYALANGIGRTKLNRDSTLKKLQDWRTIAIMTGETLLLPDNVTGGANTRLLTIKAPKEILPADVCKIIRDITPDNYGLALPLVIDKVFEFGREKLRGVYKDLVDVFTAKYPALLPEYCRYMAVLTLADTLLNSALFGNTVTNEDGKTFTALEDATLCAKEIFKLIPTRAEIDDTPREKEFVRDVIGKNQNHFIGGNVEEKKIQGIWGKLKDADGYTYITVPALRDACADGGFDYRKLVSDLIADGFFKPADNTKKGRKTPLDTVQKRLGEVNTRCYRIPNTAFEETE